MTTASRLKRITAEESGATLAEYALLVALIAAVVIVSVGLVGSKIGGGWNSTIQQIIAALP